MSRCSPFTIALSDADRVTLEHRIGCYTGFTRAMAPSTDVRTRPPEQMMTAPVDSINRC